MNTDLLYAALAFGIAMTTNSDLKADTFGGGANAFTIDFVEIGNPGNLNDAGAGGGIYSSPYGGVSYEYRMGVYEISQDQITMAVNSGMSNVTAGAWAGSQPAANITWYEAAAFVNWLNTSTGHQAAYDLTWDGSTWNMSLWSSQEAWQLDGENLYRHKDAYYFLPSEDEWYKAAYHKNDGATANYWDFATGSNTYPTAVVSGTDPGTVVSQYAASQFAAVNSAGGLSSYGTMAQSGNIWEWNESAFDGVNSSPSESHTLRGGALFGPETDPSNGLKSQDRSNGLPDEFEGFRVASLPEPTSAALIVTGFGILFLKRRQRIVP